jgi:hypothetical protein
VNKFHIRTYIFSPWKDLLIIDLDIVFDLIVDLQFFCDLVLTKVVFQLLLGIGRNSLELLLQDLGMISSHSNFLVILVAKPNKLNDRMIKESN